MRVGGSRVARNIARNIAAELGNFFSRYHYFNTGKVIMLAMLVFFLYFFLNRSIKGTILIAILGAAASYSTFYKKFVKIPSAIELVTLGTVVTSVSYGPLAGALFGAITTLISEVVSEAMDIFTFLYVFARAVIGMVAFHLYPMNVWLLGILMVLLFNGICQPFYLLPGDLETKIKAIYFFVINIAFNALIFFLLGNFLLGISL